MRIVHTADVHLRGARDDRFDALVAVVDAARELKADALVVAGDLFDRDIDAAHLRAGLREVFDRFGGATVIIPGNHDAGGLREGDFFGAGVSLSTELSPVDVGGVRFVCMPFAEGSAEATLERLHESSKHVDADRTNVLLFHGELLDLVPEKGTFGDEGGGEYMPVRLASFAGLGFDYVLAGHFHRSHSVHRYDGGYFVYSGSPVSITRRETGPRHVNIIDVGEAPRSHVLSTRHYVSVDVSLSPFDTQKPLEKVDAALAAVTEPALGCVVVRGFADLSRAGYTEQSFYDALRVLATRHRVDGEIAHRWQDVGAILDNDVFRRFNRKLDAMDLSAEEVERIRRVSLGAFMESAHAR